eukprot:3042572-Pyramimonas_sp.AAC.1
MFCGAGFPVLAVRRRHTGGGQVVIWWYETSHATLRGCGYEGAWWQRSVRVRSTSRWKQRARATFAYATQAM